MTTLGRLPRSLGAGVGDGDAAVLSWSQLFRGLCLQLLLVVVDMVWRCLNGSWRASEWSWGWKHGGQSREPTGFVWERGLVIAWGLCRDGGSAAMEGLRPGQPRAGGFPG